MEIIKVTASEVELAANLFDQYRVFYGNESDLALARTFIGERIANAESVVFWPRMIQGTQSVYPALPHVFFGICPLNDLYVSADVRGQGYGKALMNAAKDFAIETGAKGLALETAHDNQNAQKLYESLGYQRDEHYYSYFLSV
jgi:ribosomal protein S18 acetylase RimI-like enzyme